MCFLVHVYRTRKQQSEDQNKNTCLADSVLFITALCSFLKGVELAKLSPGTQFNIYPSVFSENKYKIYPFKQHDCAF